MPANRSSSYSPSRDRRVDERTREDELLPREHLADDVVGEPHPEALGIDLRAVREQRLPALVQVVADVDQRREVVLAIRRRSRARTTTSYGLSSPRVEVRLVQRLHARRSTSRRSRASTAATARPGVRVRLGITRRVERGTRDLVHADVVGMRVEVAIVAVRDDDLRALGADDAHEPLRPLRRAARWRSCRAARWSRCRASRCRGSRAGAATS